MSLDVLKEFLDRGRYIEMIMMKHKAEIFRDYIKSYQQSYDLKRIKWINEGVIGLFQSVRVFSEDRQGLNEFLMYHGVLPKVVDILWKNIKDDDKERLVNWIIPQLPVVRFTPNKNNRAKDLFEFNESVKKMSISMQVHEWRKSKIQYDFLNKEWMAIMHQLKFKFKRDQHNITLEQGTISCKQREPNISGTTVYEKLSRDAVESYGVVNHQKLRLYLAKGFVKPSEVRVFRRVEDVEVRYILKVIEHNFQQP